MSGQVAGVFTDASGVQHGFLRSSTGSYTTFNFPTGSSGVFVSMNDPGQVAGSYRTTDAVYHGFLRDTNGTFTSFTLPGTQTIVNDINQGGSIVGQYGPYRKPHHGFLRRPDGTTVTLDYPGATLTTSGDCINQTGTIAGHYQISTTNTVDHGFIVTGVH